MVCCATWKKQHNDREDEEPNNDICEIESLTRTKINKEYENVANVVHETQNDHDKGIYICMCMCFKFNLHYIIFIMFHILNAYHIFFITGT